MKRDKLENLLKLVKFERKKQKRSRDKYVDGIIKIGGRTVSMIPMIVLNVNKGRIRLSAMHVMMMSIDLWTTDTDRPPVVSDLPTSLDNVFLKVHVYLVCMCN